MQSLGDLVIRATDWEIGGNLWGTNVSSQLFPSTLMSIKGAIYEQMFRNTSTKTFL